MTIRQRARAIAKLGHTTADLARLLGYDARWIRRWRDGEVAMPQADEWLAKAAAGLRTRRPARRTEPLQPRAVRTPHGSFSSVGEAAAAIGISRQAVWSKANRLMPGWRFADDDRPARVKLGRGADKSWEPREYPANRKPRSK